jgi:hypothetical protein
MAYTDRDDLNYLGILYTIGNNKTPFLNMAGGLNGGKTVRSFQFPVSQYVSLTSASQAVVSEANAVAAGAPTTITKTQAYNVCQIMKYNVAVSYMKQAAFGEFSGIQVEGVQPDRDPLSTQQALQLKQLANDLDWSLIQGTFVDVGTSATEQKTRGIEEAISTNVTPAGATVLSKSHVDGTLQKMWEAGAPMENIVAWVNAFQKRKLSEIYGFQPTSINVGGVNIERITTDFGDIGVMLDPNVTTSVVDFVDMNYISVVYLPHQVKENNIYKGAPKRVSFTKEYNGDAAVGGFWLTMVGLDYTNEIFHGQITGLTTS